MYIRKFLLVSYIVSVVLGIVYIYRNKIINLLDTDILWLDNDDDMLFELYIPRINLRRFVYTIDSRFNNVDYNIEILKETDLDNNLFFLASHSGSGKASYFDYLVYLDKGDLVWINFKDKHMVFVIEEMFYIQKNGYFEAIYDYDGNTLFLITCSLKYVNMQLVVRTKMIYEC